MISILLAIVTCVTMVCSVLFFPKIRLGKVQLDSYWVVVLAGAVLTLCTGQVDLVSLGAAMVDDSAINPLKILVLFLSMTVLSVFLDEVDFFRYLAVKSLGLAKTSQMLLFTVLYLTVSLLTVFTSNDIIVLTFTPFICYFAKNAEIDPKPYLFGEFIAANTMSMTLIIGNPTNIYIAASSNIQFLDYARVMLLPTLASSATAFFVLWLLFRKSLRRPMKLQKQEARVENRPYLIIGITVLAVCTVLLAVGSYVKLDMWLVSLVSALVLFAAVGVTALVRRNRPVELLRTLARAPWTLVPFVLSMFVLILAVSQNGVTEWMTAVLGQEHTVFRYGIASFLAANLINNIPMSVLFCPVIQPLTGAVAVKAVYATVVGSNLGAFLTPVGALAGIMWMSLLKKQQVSFGFRDFIRYGAAVAIPTLLVNLAVLNLLL